MDKQKKNKKHHTHAREILLLNVSPDTILQYGNEEKASVSSQAGGSKTKVLLPSLKILHSQSVAELEEGGVRQRRPHSFWGWVLLEEGH